MSSSSSSSSIKFNINSPAAEELVLVVHEKLKEVWESQLEDYAVAQYAVGLVSRGQDRKKIANNLTGVLPEDAKTLLLDWLLKHIKLHKKELTSSVPVPKPQPKPEEPAPAEPAALSAEPAAQALQEAPLSDVEALLQDERHNTEYEAAAAEQQQQQQQQEQQPRLTEQQIQEIRHRKEQRQAQEAQQQQQQQQQQDGKASKIEWNGSRAKGAEREEEEHAGKGRRPSGGRESRAEDSAEVRRAQRFGLDEQPSSRSRRSSHRSRSRDRSRNRDRDRSRDRSTSRLGRSGSGRERRERRGDLGASVREAGREREREREREKERERERERTRAHERPRDRHHHRSAAALEHEGPPYEPQQYARDDVPVDRHNEPFVVQHGGGGGKSRGAAAARMTPPADVEGGVGPRSAVGGLGGAKAFSRQLRATLGGLGRGMGEDGPRAPRGVSSRIQGRLGMGGLQQQQQQQQEQLGEAEDMGFGEQGEGVPLYEEEELPGYDDLEGGGGRRDRVGGRGSVFDRLARPQQKAAEQQQQQKQQQQQQVQVQQQRRQSPAQVASPAAAPAGKGSVFSRLEGGPAGGRKRGLEEDLGEQAGADAEGVQGAAAAAADADYDPHDLPPAGAAGTAAGTLEGGSAVTATAGPQSKVAKRGPGPAAAALGLGSPGPAGAAAAVQQNKMPVAAPAAALSNPLQAAMPGIVPGMGGGGFAGHPFMAAAVHLFGPMALGTHPSQLALLFQQVGYPEMAAAAAAAAAGAGGGMLNPGLQQQQQLLLLQQQRSAAAPGARPRGPAAAVAPQQQQQGRGIAGAGAGTAAAVAGQKKPGGPANGTAAAAVPEQQKQLSEMELVQRNLKKKEIEVALIKKGMASSQAAAMADAQLNADAANAARQASDQRSVLVQNVHFAANEQIVAAHFGPCGVIKRVTLLRDKFTGAPKGSAYVELSSPEEVQRALTLSKSMLLGMPITVVPKPPSTLRHVPPPPFPGHKPQAAQQQHQQLRQQHQQQPSLARVFNNTYVAPSAQQPKGAGAPTNGPPKKLADMPALPPGKRVWRREVHEAGARDPSSGQGGQQQQQQQPQQQPQQQQQAQTT